jgi:spore coat polysaccharide biosynthesis protein SpsF (cytidylyltransferase family)
LIPEDDHVLSSLELPILVLKGPEEDVLTRYARAAKSLNADYIVRVTSDCPLLPPDLITKHVFTASNHNLDYMSNTYPKGRTYADGFDTEVISKRLIEWLDTHIKDEYHREHVTSAIHHMPPEWIKKGACRARVDNEHLKLSLDTEEDFKSISEYMKYQQVKYDYLKNNCEIVVTH